MKNDELAWNSDRVVAELCSEIDDLEVDVEVLSVRPEDLSVLAELVTANLSVVSSDAADAVSQLIGPGRRLGVASRMGALVSVGGVLGERAETQRTFLAIVLDQRRLSGESASELGERVGILNLADFEQGRRSLAALEAELLAAWIDGLDLDPEFAVTALERSWRMRSLQFSGEARDPVDRSLRSKLDEIRRLLSEPTGQEPSNGR